VEIIYANVASLEESIVASALPMMTEDVTFEDFNIDMEEQDMPPYVMDFFGKKYNSDVLRARKLGHAKIGSGHDCYLKGIHVFLVMKASDKFWKQWERYSFQDTVSSTSTMHKILSVDLLDVLPDTIYPETLRKLQEDIYIYNNDDDIDEVEKRLLFEKITDNIPMGYQYTRAVTTNYLQLKTMVIQRNKHKLEEWREFCDFCLRELPMFDVLTGFSERDYR